jgi:outer membrane protein assembly factor BamB
VPVVFGNRVFVTCPTEKQDGVLAFDMEGKEIWRKRLGPESAPKHQSLASSANASPCTDGKSLFVYFRSGNFAALDFDGNVRWQVNLVEKFGKDNLFWDQGTSPVVTDNFVIMARMHGGDSWVAGFDKNTGDLKWKEPRNFETPVENNNGYSTPIFCEVGGVKAFLLWSADHLTAHSASNGKTLGVWDEFNPEGTGYWPAIASPVLAGNVVIVPVGRDDHAQARVHGIKLGESFDPLSTKRIWKREDTGVFVTTPAYYKGRVYLLRNKNEVVCLDPETGKTIWTGLLQEHRTPYYSSPVVAGGILYAAREDGVIFTARVDEKFELLGENPMGERIIASPVPVDGKLFIRGDAHLFCIVN